MKNVRIGSSIKVIIDNKEKFYTVESYKGDIGLYQKGVIKHKIVRVGDMFTFRGVSYRII